MQKQFERVHSLRHDQQDSRLVLKPQSMASACTSTRCTKCGKKKRPVFDDGTRDIELVESQALDTFWSPLDSLERRYDVQSSLENLAFRAARTVKLDAVTMEYDSSEGRYDVQSSPGNPTSRAARTIEIDAVTRHYDSDDSLSQKREGRFMEGYPVRREAKSSGRHTSVARFLQNFARGMASAFGTSLSRKAETNHRPWVDDLESGNLKASRSMLPAVLPPSSRIRLFFSRMGGGTFPFPPEQRPPVGNGYKNMSSYRLSVPSTFRLRTV